MREAGDPIKRVESGEVEKSIPLQKLPKRTQRLSPLLFHLQPKKREPIQLVRVPPLKVVVRLVIEVGNLDTILLPS